ncbi:MAG: hypothetical protein GX968_00715 [Tissierellia bacterium]|nr:hypothetical protein [Tissierellia bacterium]
MKLKLIIAIVQDEITNQVVKNLMAGKYRTTKLSSTGGFLKSGNTTLLIGVENKDVKNVVNIIEESCKSKKVNKGKEELDIGSATIFVLNMEDYKRI